jgi:glucose-1-phosphate thymidylyltransferase
MSLIRERIPVPAWRAVVLARGLGQRMRAADAAALLDPAQSIAADAGMKAMVPMTDTGRPFLDYVLSGLADAGFTEVCLVLGPEHDAVRARYGALGPAKPTRIRIMYAVQQKPTGTADALLAAEPLLAGAPFVVLNGDNYYPVDVMRELRRMTPPALPAFDAQALVAGGIPEERIAQFATLDIAQDGHVFEIREKPLEGAAVQPGTRVSMNLWLLDKEIFRACREVPLSRRNEHELPEAVQWAIARHGVTCRTFPVAAPVLDLSRRGDIAAVSAALAGVEVNL